MKIGAILNESSIDYPGKYGPVIFLAGCNYRCGFCHNPELALNTQEPIKKEDLDIFFKNLKIKTQRGYYNGITISGGEPTLNGGLPYFLKDFKNMGLAVKLDTNGSNFGTLARLSEEKLVDYLALDIKGPQKLYHELIGADFFEPRDGIEKSMAIAQTFPKYEFRTTITKRYHTPENCVDMIKWVRVSTQYPPILVLQGFKNSGSLLDSSFKDEPDVEDEYLFKIKEAISPYCDEVKIR